MEGGKEIGEGSSRRKRQAERRSSRRRAEEPPVEEEVPEVAMGEEEEEERMAPIANVEEERKRRSKAMKTGEMRARVSWTLVLAAFLAFPRFQRERVEEMGFGEIFRIERMRVDLALTQALRSRWDSEASAFAFPWGHMIPSLEDVSRITGLNVYGRAVSGYTYPCYHSLAERLLDLPVERRSVWLHALNLVLPLNLFLTQRSLGFRQSVVEFPIRDRFRRPGRSFRGLHDTTDWRDRAREQIENWERKGKAVRSEATTDDAYLQAYALKYGGKVYKSARHQRSELERVRGTGAGGASSSRSAGGYPSLIEARLTGGVLRAEEAQRHLEEQERDLELAHEHAMELQSERDRFRGEAQTTRSERDQLRIRGEAAETQVAEMVRELAMLWVQRSPGDQEEVTRLRAELLA
ncbi:hypothetical protein Taro_001916 [Colocasia esculenta]|uniref:Aminotransferase-like plant mobile domain-containing protein n=1 Tax=Colocasia esculenta TaxID=4460 RepID=A0A843THP1_COLES|nr:hypothetical protein [Colocasia esculenta]